MAPLSCELSELILPHDHYGSHLNNSNERTNDDLELKNFDYAGNVLCEVWNGVEAD